MPRTIEYAREGRFEELQEAWLESLPEGLTTKQMVEILGILSADGAHDLARELLELTLEEMDTAGVSGIAKLCKGAAELFDESDLLRHHLLESLRDEYLMFEPLEFFFRKSGLSKKGSSIRESWKSLQCLMMYHNGGYILHSNFGPGEIRRVTRSSITVDFQKSRDHDMTIEAAVETTTPLESNSLLISKWRNPAEFELLPVKNPSVFLERLLQEAGEDASVNIDHLRPYLEGTSLESSTVWKKLRSAAASSQEFTDLGDRITLSSDSSAEAQIRAVLSDRKTALSEKNRIISALLRQTGGMTETSLSRLQEEISKLDNCETGAGFELAWILASGSRKEISGPVIDRFVESSTSRALRALGEIHSPSCRKVYLEAFLNRITEREEIFRLLSELTRTLWFHTADILTEKDPDMLSICATLFLGEPSAVDRYMWTLELVSKKTVKGDFPGRMELVSLIIHNLCFARADTQKRMSGLLQKELRPEFERFLKQTDSRNLGSITSELEKSSSLHGTGLILLLLRELSSRKRGSGLREKRFWESDVLFDSVSAIERRHKAIENLVSIRIPEAAEAIAEAASHGDLSENAEYAAALEKRDFLLDTLRRWKAEFEKLRPYPEDEVTRTVVSPGTRAILSEIDGKNGERLSYSIVGPLEADPGAGRINYLAPLGAALLGRERGDTVTFPTGDPGMEYRIDDIEILQEVSKS